MAVVELHDVASPTIFALPNPFTSPELDMTTTNPQSGGGAPPTAPAVAAAPPPPKFTTNFCNDDFPLLSLAYAIYCGRSKQGTFMDVEAAEVKASFGREIPDYQPPPTKAVVTHPKIYRRWLDYYTTNQKRRFPAKAKRVVTEEV